MNRDGIEIYLTQEGLLRYAKAIGIYMEFLIPHNKKGNHQIAEEIDHVSFYIKYLRRKAKSFSEREFVFFIQDIGLSSECLALLKATLPLLKQKLEIENSKLPQAACEANNKEIKQIEDVLQRDWLVDITPHNFLVPIELEEPESVINPMVVHNTSITNHNGVVAIGNNIHIQQNFTELSKLLQQLEEVVNQADTVKQSDKDLVRVNINTIQPQLALEKPNKSIVKVAWESIQAAANVEGAIALIGRATPLIDAITKGLN